jgi:hypothetical protein
MKKFDQALYEAYLVAFGKTLAKYNVFSEGAILKDVGQEILNYLNKQGFTFDEKGELEDLVRLTNLFVDNGFAEKLEIQDADRGKNYVWHNLFGLSAYKELHEIAENPFLSCPLNLCLYYVADKHGKTMQLLSKSFDIDSGVTESQYDIVDKPTEAEAGAGADPLVIENIRLYELAKERADKLEKAYREIKVLRGIIPMCSKCKKIRNDEGYWQQVEGYISQHSEAMFTHGICSDCMHDLYPDYLDQLERPDAEE